MALEIDAKAAKAAKEVKERKGKDKDKGDKKATGTTAAFRLPTVVEIFEKGGTDNSHSLNIRAPKFLSGQSQPLDEKVQLMHACARRPDVQHATSREQWTRGCSIARCQRRLSFCNRWLKRYVTCGRVDGLVRQFGCFARLLPLVRFALFVCHSSSCQLMLSVLIAGSRSNASASEDRANSSVPAHPRSSGRSTISSSRRANTNTNTNTRIESNLGSHS